MRRLTICTAALLLAGCTGTMEFAKLRTRPGYSMEVNASWDQVHRCLYLGMQTYGWGGDWHIEQLLEPSQERGSIWPYDSYSQQSVGFAIEISAEGPDRSRVTVHPANDWYARKSRAWAVKTLRREFGDDIIGD